MKCPHCDRNCQRRKWQWKCIPCNKLFPLGDTKHLQAAVADAPRPRRRKSAVDQSRAPRADRFRHGDVWADLQGRPHLVMPCVRPELVVLEALDHELVPVAADRLRPSPWVRLEWGGVE